MAPALLYHSNKQKNPENIIKNSGAELKDM